MERAIHITEHDHQRLRQLVSEAKFGEYRGSDYLDDLEKELERARIVPPQEIPPAVITMNSKVRLVDTDTGDEEIYTLVFPADADHTQNKISILAPIGTAMLGYCVGDTFEWKVPAGTLHMKVAEVIYQPEAAGDFDL